MGAHSGTRSIVVSHFFDARTYTREGVSCRHTDLDVTRRFCASPVTWKPITRAVLSPEKIDTTPEALTLLFMNPVHL